MEKEITNFDLRYDGMYHIKWSDAGKTHKWYINLGISVLMRILEIEGITLEQVIKAEKELKPIRFKNVKLKCFIEEGHFVAYGFFDEYLGNTLRESFTVELSQGDAIKNYEHETIMGDIELMDDLYNDIWQDVWQGKF